MLRQRTKAANKLPLVILQSLEGSQNLRFPKVDPSKSCVREPKPQGSCHYGHPPPVRARARAKIIIREVSIRKVKPQKDALRMHAAASSSSSSYIGAFQVFKQTFIVRFHLWVIKNLN